MGSFGKCQKDLHQWIFLSKFYRPRHVVWCNNTDTYCLILIHHTTVQAEYSIFPLCLATLVKKLKNTHLNQIPYISMGQGESILSTVLSFLCLQNLNNSNDSPRQTFECDLNLRLIIKHFKCDLIMNYLWFPEFPVHLS